MAFIQKNNITLHYQWLNQHRDQTIVFINSLGTNFSIWSEVISLINHEFNVLIFDKRGHGLSATEEGYLTIDDYADDVIFLMDYLSIEKTNVFGLSIGGMITYSLASRHPSRFDKLIFSNTGAKLGTPEAWHMRIKTIKEKGINAISEDIIARWFSENYRKAHPAATVGYTNMLERNTVLGYTQACAAIGDADFNPILKKINHPVMFLGGSADIGTTPKLVEENARNLGAERVEIIEGVGHLPCIEAPKAVAEFILEFCSHNKDLSLYERGMKIRRAVLGDTHVDKAEANKTEFDKDFQTYIVKSAWGSIWARSHLTKRERSMITIALLAALGHKEELEMHILATRHTDTTWEDIKEVLMHTGVYAGVPITNGAMKIAKNIFQNLNSQLNE